MPHLLSQRYPRYGLLLALVLFGTFVWLSPDNAFTRRVARTQAAHAADHTLAGRIARSEAAYERILDRRQAMIKKYGPSPSQVVMFPPDQEPWPAYTVWDFFPPVFNCPHEAERIGTLGDGGKWVCGLSRIEDKPDCVIYSFGLDWDSSFEAELLQRTKHCEVWGYDYVAPGFGGSIPRTLRPRTHFARLGLGASDSHGASDSPKMWTLQSLMKANGHRHIDILHIDIEGWEFEVLRAMVRDFIGVQRATVGGAVGGAGGVDAVAAAAAAVGGAEEAGAVGAGLGMVGAGAGAQAQAGEEGAGLPFGQLLIELHVWHQRFTEFLGFFSMLEGVGLRPFMSEVNLVYANYNRQSGVELAGYSFLNIRGENAFISDGAGARWAGGAGADGAGREGQRERDAGEAEEPDVRMIRHAAVRA